MIFNREDLTTLSAIQKIKSVFFDITKLKENLLLFTEVVKYYYRQVKMVMLKVVWYCYELFHIVNYCVEVIFEGLQVSGTKVYVGETKITSGGKE
jgi:hypothetical protein